MYQMDYWAPENNLLHHSTRYKKFQNQYYISSNRQRNLILAKFLYFFSFAKFNSRKIEKLPKSQKILDCNWTRTHNHLVCKQRLNDLAKLAK